MVVRGPRRHLRPNIRTPKWRVIAVILCSLLIIFTIANVGLWAVYRNRTYPRTSVMNAALGSVTYGSLAQKTDELNLLPESVMLISDNQKTTVPLKEFGAQQNASRTTDSAHEQRSWLPILNLFKSAQLLAPVAIDDKVFTQKAQELEQTFRKEPVNARLVLDGPTVNIVPAAEGYELDQSTLRQRLYDSLDEANTNIRVPTHRIKPKVHAINLSDDQQALDQQLSTTITLRYNGKSRQATRADIATWYIQSGEIYQLSADSISEYINKTGSLFGIRVQGTNHVVATITTGLTNRKNTDITLVAYVAKKTYTYCVASKGVDTDHLSTLRQKLQSTLGDPRGWSLGGQIDFQNAASNCDFTVWLSSANLLPTFGAICDPMWSCRVGANVVLNFDRWQGASPAWNASGGSLEDYRSMLINHETGHWLSFGHKHCDGPGQSAPVMQQQSIDLEGCVFNPWPTSAELSALGSRLGL